MVQYTFAIIVDSADEGATSGELYENYEEAYEDLWRFVEEERQHREYMFFEYGAYSKPEETYPRAYIFELETAEDRKAWAENMVKALMDRTEYYWEWHDIYDEQSLPRPLA